MVRGRTGRIACSASALLGGGNTEPRDPVDDRTQTVQALAISYRPNAYRCREADGRSAS
jgi:hypothetical protein